MKSEKADVVIIGAGVFSLATALELARRGHSVIAIDRFGSGHPATSSTGASRSIRVAYDHPFYVSLAIEAIESWRRLEATTARSILHLTGQIDLGPPSKLSDIAHAVCRAGIAIDELTPKDLRQRMPELAIGADESALFHAMAGTVMAEEGMRALREAAIAGGAIISAPERVLQIENGPKAVVYTDRRRLEADVAIVSAGPWSKALLADLGFDLPLVPAVAQVTFLDAPTMVDRPGIAEWEADDSGGVYGHPVPGIGYKIAFSSGAAGWDPDVENWQPDLEEEQRLMEWRARRFPGAPAKIARTHRHPWTMTPDVDFIVDRVESVAMACGCSGHAFKFGPALGRMVADVVEGKPRPEHMRMNRPALKTAAPSPSAPIIR